MIFTNEQIDILNQDLNLNDKNILIIEALAGSGKTRILIEFIKKYKDKKFLYLSFNKENSESVKLKVNKLKNIEIHNIHSIAYKKTIKHFKNMNIKKLEVEELSEILNFKNYELLYKIKNEFSEYCKQIENIDDFINKRKKDIKYKKCKIFNNVKEYIFIQIYLYKLENLFFSKQINFITHDVYLKYFIDNLQEYQLIKNYDVLLVDEAQDLNLMMFKIVEEFINNNKFTICVGDTNQSIYSFLKNINILKVIKNTKKYKNRLIKKSLTRSFRFEKDSDIEKLSNLILTQRDAKIIGDASHINKIIKDTLYLSRTNKSIFDKINEWCNLGKRFNLIGGINSFNILNINDIFNLLINKIELINNKYILEFKQYDNPIEKLMEKSLNEENFEMVSDIKIAKKIYKDGGNPDIVFGGISKMIDINSNDYIGTIHKTKGTDFDRVVLINNNMWKDIYYLAFSESKNPNKSLNSLLHNGKIYKIYELDNENFNILEEYNLLYVAITRAKKELSIQDPKYYETLKLLKNINNIVCEKLNFNDVYEDFYLFEDYVIRKEHFENFKEIISN
jgi:superfamily I DNA/RNA helicase